MIYRGGWCYIAAIHTYMSQPHGKQAADWQYAMGNRIRMPSESRARVLVKDSGSLELVLHISSSHVFHVR